MPVRLATEQEVTEAREASRKILAAAAVCCTDRQLQTPVLWENGMSQAAIAREQGVANSTVRSVIDAGC